MSEDPRDTESDAPEIHAVKHDGRWVLAEEDGKPGAWVAAETAVQIEYMK